MKLHPTDLDELQRAVMILENPSLVARLTHLVGSPLERALDWLPAPVSNSVHEASRRAIAKALDVAVFTLGNADLEQRPKQPPNPTHKLLSGLSGAVGGFFGAPALAVELPVSTLIMLRSIAAIARDHGEDILVPDTKLACLEVFALGGRSQLDDGTDTGYYAVRTALASAVAEAAHYLAERQLIDGGAPALVRLIAAIASRFGIVASQKFALQAVPVVGALGGASINLLFMNHFQDMAGGHFSVRQLERRYSKELVEAEYKRLRDQLP